MDYMGEIIPFRPRPKRSNTDRRLGPLSDSPMESSASSDPYRQAYELANEIWSRFKVTFAHPRQGHIDSTYIRLQRMIERCLVSLERKDNSLSIAATGGFKVDFQSPRLSWRRMPLGRKILELPSDAQESDVTSAIAELLAQN